MCPIRSPPSAWPFRCCWASAAPRGSPLYLGKGEPDKAARLAGNGVLLMAGAGVLYLVIGEAFLTPLLRVFGATEEVLPYAQQYAGIVLLGMPFLILTNGISNLIRADGSPRYSMLCMLAGAIVNTILDPVFIFGMKWGVFGAALATILGQFLSFFMAMRYLWHFKTIRITRQCFVLDLRDSLRTFYMGISSCINQVAITLVQIVLNNSLTYYGAKKYDRVRRAYLLAIQWNFAVSAVGFVLFQFLPGPIISIFGSGDELYFEFSILFMRTFLFMVLVNGVQLLSSNFFTAIGKALKGLLLSLTRQVFFLIPLILILPLKFGIFGVLLAGPIADFIAFVVSVVLVRREFKNLKTQTV